MPRKSLTEYFEELRRFGSRTAVVHRRSYRTSRWSYRELAETASRFARELEARNIAKGDRVFLWGENSPEWIACFWGCMLRGALVVPMDYIASTDFARRVCNDVDAKLIVCSDDRANSFADKSVMRLETLPETIAHHNPGPYASDAKRSDPIEIIFTSGTTADPKGVVITHGNILANLEPIEAGVAEYRSYLRIAPTLNLMNVVPLSHVFGQIMTIFIAPVFGGTVILQNGLNPSEIVRAIKKEHIVTLVAVPRIIESLQQKLERDMEAQIGPDWLKRERDASAKERFIRRWWRFRKIHRYLGWRFCSIVSGGARLDEQLESFWSSLGFVVIQGYGLTETTSLVSLNHPFRASKGSIGKALPGREVKLDPSGEILVRGDSVASGYWQLGSLRPTEEKDGWFHTGDLGELDSQGNLFFKGRKKSVIVGAEGMNIYPEDLESALRSQPGVRDAVVFGIDREGREVPCAVIVVCGRSDAAQAGVFVQHANEALAEFQRIREWLLWPDEDFPRTSTQKPLLGVIKERAEKLIGRKVSSNVPVNIGGPQNVSEIIRSITGRASTSLSSDSRLEADLNLSSIDRVELLSALEDRYQIDLNESAVAGATTVGDLERMLSAPSRSGLPFPYPKWPQSRWINAFRRFVYYMLVLPTTAILGYPKVSGKKNLSDVNGPVLIVSNHVTPIDLVFLLIALPARIGGRLAVAMAGERLRLWRFTSPERQSFSQRFNHSLQRMVYYLVVTLFNVFPLPKESGFRESFEFAGESVDRGFSVLVFPEGGLTKDGKVANFRSGVGILASKLKLPVVPMRIDGLFELRQAGKRFSRPGKIHVKIGAPVSFETDDDPATIATKLKDSVVGLS